MNWFKIAKRNPYHTVAKNIAKSIFNMFINQEDLPQYIQDINQEPIYNTGESLKKIIDNDKIHIDRIKLTTYILD